MNNDCVKCKSMCCMAGLSYSALLTEKEVERLKNALRSNPDLAKTVGTEDFCYYDEKIGAYKMRKFADNRCVFWNSETSGCRVYLERPLDCKIFPREYRWFMWLHSPQCPSKNFKCSSMVKQLEDYTPSQVRHLKYLHIMTPESTRDNLWMFALKVWPIAACYKLYAKIRERLDSKK